MSPESLVLRNLPETKQGVYGYSAAADEALGWGRVREDHEGPDCITFQEASCNGMDYLDLNYLSTPHVDTWLQDPAQYFTQILPTSYTGRLHVALCNCRQIVSAVPPTPWAYLHHLPCLKGLSKLVTSGVHRGVKPRMHISAADVTNSTDAEKSASNGDHPTP